MAINEVNVDSPITLFFRWSDDPSYGRLRLFREGVLNAIGVEGDARSPLILVFDQDVAWIVGDPISRELPAKRRIV